MVYEGFAKKLTEMAQDLLLVAEGVYRLERDFKILNDWKLTKFSQEMKARADKALEGGLNSVEVHEVWTGKGDREAVRTLPQRLSVETRCEGEAQGSVETLSPDGTWQADNNASADGVPQAERLHSSQNPTPEDPTGLQPGAKDDPEKHS